MYKKNLVIIILVAMAILILITGCVRDKPQDNTTPDNNSTPLEPEEPNVEDEPKETSANTTWPAGRMKDLPEPKGNIVFVYEHEDKEDKDYTVIVQFEVNGREDALEYYNRLKELGYRIELDNVDDKGINLDGEKNEVDLKFGYIEGQKTASVKLEY